MDHRLDDCEIPRLGRLEQGHKWFALQGVIGHTTARLVRVILNVQAFAWRREDQEPVLRPGPWQVMIALVNGLVVQPLVRIAPDGEGFLPASANISDWWTPAGAAGAGLVCYAGRWEPTRLTVVWIVTQVARIVAGEVFHMEAAPLSRRGRDWQAQAASQGRLPACVVPPVPDDLLFLLPADGMSRQREPHEIEFDVR